MFRLIIILSSILLFNSLVLAQDEFFLTLRNDKVNLRQGPSFEYPVKILYKKKFLPVVIQDEYGNFRKIKDHENNSGWIHVSQLSKKKAALVKDNNLIVFNNGIYELEKEIFREIRPEDYVTKTIGLDYVDFSSSDPTVKKFIRVLLNKLSN